MATGEDCPIFREGHAFTVSTAVFSPDGQHLLTSAVDNTVRVWDVATGVELPDLRLDRTGRHGAVAISADGRWILTGGDHHRDDERFLWPTRLGSEAPIRAAGRESSCDPVASDSRRGAGLGRPTVGRPQHGPASSSAARPQGGGYRRRHRAHGRILFTGDRQRSLRIWDRESGRELRRFWDDEQSTQPCFFRTANAC